MRLIHCETHSLRAFMLKSNRQTKGNKEVMHIKTPICNALTVAHKCKGLLPIKANMTIKRKQNETKRYTQLSSQKPLLSRILL